MRGKAEGPLWRGKGDSRYLLQVHSQRENGDLVCAVLDTPPYSTEMKGEAIVLPEETLHEFYVEEEVDGPN